MTRRPEERVDTMPDFYPEDLQTKAREIYKALPQSGTVTNLIEQIQTELPTRKIHETRDTHCVTQGQYVRVAWKETIFTGIEREVIKTGVLTTFVPSDPLIRVAVSTAFMSHRGGSSFIEAPIGEGEDYVGYREIKWEFIKQD
jgi:hypothetical protein